MVEVQVLASWLTPTSLFVLLNIVLATIFLNHNSKNNHHNNHHSTTTDTTSTTTTTHSQPHPQLMRAPSLFSRVASFNFSHYYHSHQDSYNMSPPPATAASVAAPPVVETITRAPSLLFRVASFKLGWTSPPPPPQQQQEQASVNENKMVNEKEAREISEGHVMREKAVEEEEVKVKVVSKKKKVVKKKEMMGGDVAKVEKKTTAFKKEDEEVDTKADDFINKFKQQLKMQRLESLLRYGNATPSA